MAKYTTELRSICEVLAGYDSSVGYSSVNDVISKSREKIFDFSYPIFDENYKSVLETKIIKHYYTREIGVETVGLWKHFLDMRLNEIMPYYNKLYESELLEFNPFYDVDLTKDHSGNGTSDTEHERSDSEEGTNTRTDNLTRTDDLTTERDSERTDDLTRTDAFTRTDNLKSTSQDSGTQADVGADVAKNTRWDVYSDTPQGTLQNVANENYLTNARKIIDDGTGSTRNNTTTFGKKVEVDDTGTQQNGGTSKNTGTQSVEETERNTGTQKNTGTQTNDSNRSYSSEFTTGITTTDEYLEHVKGKTPGASYSKLLTEYRETFLNIDMLIIEDLSDLFMNLW